MHDDVRRDRKRDVKDHRELDDLSATISGLNSEIDVLKGKSEDLAEKRQELQKLIDAGERAKDI